MIEPRTIRAAACAIGLILLVAACTPDAGPEPPEETGLQFLNRDPGVAYVGQEVCRDCHLEEFATFSHTGMGRAFYPMVPDEVVEDFEDNNEFVDPASGLHYRMEERDGKFFQRQFMLDSRGREIAADERELIWALGSNNHSRSYVTVQDDRLFQAPVCWFTRGSTHGHQCSDVPRRSDVEQVLQLGLGHERPGHETCAVP